MDYRQIQNNSDPEAAYTTTSFRFLHGPPFFHIKYSLRITWFFSSLHNNSPYLLPHQVLASVTGTDFKHPLQVAEVMGRNVYHSAKGVHTLQAHSLGVSRGFGNLCKVTLEVILATRWWQHCCIVNPFLLFTHFCQVYQPKPWGEWQNVDTGPPLHIARHNEHRCSLSNYRSQCPHRVSFHKKLLPRSQTLVSFTRVEIG